MQNIITTKLMSNKMTPVEWLLDQMFNKKELKIISTHTFYIPNELADKAKEMENSIIKSWKDEEKIWIKQLEEKDKEIKALKHKLQLYNNKHRPLK